VVVQAIGKAEVTDRITVFVENKKEKPIGNLEQALAQPGTSTLVRDGELTGICRRVITPPTGKG
jgi:hypothetical protein